MRERVLITGASGFLGFHILEAAIAQNLDVFAAVRRGSKVEHFSHLPVKLIYLDYSNMANLKNEMTTLQFDYIIHAAGLTKARNEAEYHLVNTEYAHNLGLAAKAGHPKLKKFVLISSLAAIGPLRDSSVLIDENTLPNPVTWYGKSKMSAEKKLLELGLPLVILRPTAIYGPRDKDIFILFKTINKGLEIYLGKQPQLLSFIHAKDVAQVSIASLFTKNEGCYNLSDGCSYSRYDFASILKKYMRRKTLKIYLARNMVKTIAFISEHFQGMLSRASVLNREKLNELLAPNWCCKIEKAKKDLGFMPRYNLEKGIEESLAWYKENKWL